MRRKPTVHRPFQKLRPAAKPGSVGPKTFDDAMKREGTVPLGKGVLRVPSSRHVRSRWPVQSVPTFSVERDEEWLEGHRSGLAQSARDRLRGTPLSTLDLHRHDVETARRRLSSFLAKEAANGRDLVLVIVGRGRHSPGGEAVLRNEIADWLTSPPAAAHVLAFRTAPRELGGSGGVLVVLSRAPRRRIPV